MVLHWWSRFEACIELWIEMIIYRLAFKGWDIILKSLIFYLLVTLADSYSNITKYTGLGGGGTEILRINFDIVPM